MFKASNTDYEFDGRYQGISHGGIGLIHLLAKRTGLLKEIDKHLELLQRHLPYPESDYITTQRVHNWIGILNYSRLRILSIGIIILELD